MRPRTARAALPALLVAGVLAVLPPAGSATGAVSAADREAEVARANGVSRAELREAELKAVRQARADDKEAARVAAADKVAAAAAAVAADEEAALAEKRGARKERKQLTKAEAQSKRDARYAARKAR